MFATNEFFGGKRHASATYFVAALWRSQLRRLQRGSAAAQDIVKIGLVLPMTGTVGAAGQEVAAAVKLYMAQHGDTVAGKKIELIIRDDGSIPDNAKRLAQELVVNDQVAILGAGTTPSAMSMAPIATEGKVPTVVMISGTSVVTERSPYYVRTCFTLGQQSGIIADWALKNGSKKAVSVLSDWAPGAEAGKVFEQHFNQGGGQVLETLKVPLANPGFRAVPATRRRPEARIRCSCSCRPDRPARSPGNSPSAASTSPASSWSARATSSTTTIWPRTGDTCSASSPPASIRRRIRPRSTRTTSRPTPRPPAASAPISSRSAAMTACT